jgi:hypothetical protein
MNCTQGDLAVIVRSWAGNEGKIVRCIELVGLLPASSPGGRARVVPIWRVDRALMAWDGTCDYEAADDQLRPIRDNDGEDEILTLVGKPEKVSA